MPAVARHFAPDGTQEFGDLTREGAEHLFARLAPKTTAKRPDACNTCLDNVGRLPLVVVIVASYLELRSSGPPKKLDDAIGDVLDARRRLYAEVSLPERNAASPGTATSLHAVIHMSARTLSEEDQGALQQVAVFPPKLNSFSWSAAEAVVGTTLPVEHIYEAGLIEESEGDARLTMHQTINEYVRRGEAGDPAAYQRLADYFLEYINARAEKDKNAWLRDLDIEVANLRVVMEWLIAQAETRKALELMTALWDFWYRRNRYQTAKELAERVLGLPSADESADFHLLRASVMNSAGNFAYNLCELDDAQVWHQKALRIRDELGSHDIAGTWNNLSNVERERGCYREAIFRLEKALSLNRKVGRPMWEAFNLDNLGIALARLGDAAVAEERFLEAADVWSGIGDEWGWSMTAINLGHFYAEQGRDTTEVLRFAVPALAYGVRVDDRKVMAGAVRAVGISDYMTQRHEAAALRLDAGLALSLEVLDRLGEYHGLFWRILNDAGRGRSGDAVVGARALRAFCKVSGVVLAPTHRDLLREIHGGSNDDTSTSGGLLVFTLEADIADLIGEMDYMHVVQDLLNSRPGG
jgi:tetratricopeptide (TPR) repeat protein